MSVPGLPIVEAAALIAAARAAEEQVFTTVGRWVATVAEPDIKVALSVHSRRHGNHAMDLAAVAPTVPIAGPVPPGLDAAAAEAVAALETTVARLVALARLLLPMVVSASAFDPGPAVAAAPIIGALRPVRHDHREQAAEVDALLARALAVAHDREAVDCELSLLARITRQELWLPPSKATGDS
ncbi:MAG: hypothetical protein ACRD1K_19560 [Acidimicrobiales bacterium]